MTDDSKINLLKTLLKEQEESPGTTHGEFTEIKTIENFNNLVSHPISHNNCIVFVFDSRIYIYDSNYNLLFNDYLYIDNLEWHIADIDIDEEGFFYCIGYSMSIGQRYLIYLNDITQKVEGEYQLVVRKKYLIEDALTAVTVEKGNITANIDLKLKKSPLDSRFIFIEHGKVDNTTTPYNLVIMQYHVNFTGANDYEYRVAKVGNRDYYYDESYTVSWTENNANVKIFGRNSDDNITSITETSPVEFYVSTCDFSENSVISSTQILSSSKYLLPHYYDQEGSVFTSMDNLYFSIGEKENGYSDILIYKYDGTLKLLKKYEGNSTNNIVYVQLVMQKVNGQVFAFYRYSANTGGYNGKFLHITNSIFEYQLQNTSNIWANLIVQNTFNIYNIFLNGLIATYIYKSTGYNGDPYFSKTSVTSQTMTLFNENEKPIFNRDLYNKTLIGNSVNSITQIPFNYLNNEPIIKENLISKNNNIIDTDNKEINKNMYEELYITNIDAYKVFNNNSGSTYNQEGSLKIAKNVYNGFQDDYAITSYRINYEDGSKLDGTIKSISRTGNIATLQLFVYNQGIKNIQIFDSEYTIPFATIDFTDYEEGKLYQIIQKVKVE